MTMDADEAWLKALDRAVTSATTDEPASEPIDAIVDRVAAALPPRTALVELVRYRRAAPPTDDSQAEPWGDTGYLALLLDRPAKGTARVTAIDLGPAAVVEEAARELDGCLGRDFRPVWRRAARRIVWHVLNHACEMEDRRRPRTRHRLSSPCSPRPWWYHRSGGHPTSPVAISTHQQSYQYYTTGAN